MAASGRRRHVLHDKTLPGPGRLSISLCQGCHGLRRRDDSVYDQAVRGICNSESRRRLVACCYMIAGRIGSASATEKLAQALRQPCATRSRRCQHVADDYGRPNKNAKTG